MKGLFSGRNWLDDASLPHPHLPEGFILIAEAALREAWSRLCHKCRATGVDLANAKEDQITASLYQLLEELRVTEPPPVPGFSNDRFGSIVREGNIPDSRNDSIDLQPDLVFRSAHLRIGVDPRTNGYDGLFVECKPVDSSHPVVGCYCEKGLVKFVDGRYAWAMREAMMAAYVFNDTFPGIALSKALLPMKAAYGLKSGPSPCQFAASPNYCETVHDRLRSGETAVPIRIRHVWMPLC